MEKKQRQEEEKALDLVSILKVLLSKLWLMIPCGLIIGSLFFGAAKVFIKPVYRCTFTAYVNNQQSQINKDVVTSADLTAAQQLTKTYSLIICSNTVLSKSLSSVDSDISLDNFKKMVSTQTSDGTELIAVYVINRDPQTAYVLANAIAETAPECMRDIVEGSSMKIVDEPEPVTNPYGPNYWKYALLGFLIGALVIVIKTIIEYFSDDRVKSEQQVSEYFDIPILGVIPDVVAVTSGKNGNYYYSHYGDGKDKKNSEKGYESV